jgi:hypothetical protein
MMGLALGTVVAAPRAYAAANEAAHTQTAPRETSRKGTGMSGQARGTFDVKVGQLPSDEKVAGLPVGRNSVAKELKGDLVGTSKGEMMSVGTAVEGSAGYVAIEKVTGALKGRAGSFLLLHQGTMQKGGDFKLTIVVVPDSGTEQLVGLSGRMNIIITLDGKHSYELDYTLPS